MFFEVVLIFLKMILGDGTGKSDKFYKKPESCRSKKKPKNVDNYYNTPTSIVEKTEKGAVDNLSPYFRNCLKNKLEPACGRQACLWERQDTRAQPSADRQEIRLCPAWLKSLLLTKDWFSQFAILHSASEK